MSANLNETEDPDNKNAVLLILQKFHQLSKSINNKKPRNCLS